MPSGKARMEALGFQWQRGSAYYPNPGSVPHLHIGVPYTPPSANPNKVLFVSYKITDPPRVVRLIYTNDAWTANTQAVINLMNAAISGRLTAFRQAYNI